MDFCKKCGGILVIKDGKTVCKRCGAGTRGKIPVLKQDKPEEKEMVVVDEDEKDEALPKTKKECPECGNQEAYFWTKQTRGADEPPTTFYKCTECKKVWREY